MAGERPNSRFRTTMEKSGLKYVSGLLISSGLVLLAVWTLAVVHARIGSSSALAQFPSNGAIDPACLIPDGGATVDTSLWSDKRIAEFKASLRSTFDPPVAVVGIPRIGVEAPVFKGTDDLTLNRGVGWIRGTATPGSSGNAGIAGHRDGFFRGLKDIAVDDVIELRTRDGIQKYIVRDLAVVEPSRVDVLAPSADPTLTLVTCYPFYFVGSAPQRFIVRAVRDTSDAVPVRNPAGETPPPGHRRSD